jgi:hypothetical protein
MTNLRGSPNSGSGFLTVGFNNLEHINLYIGLNSLCIYANLKEQAWNKIRYTFLKLNRYRPDFHKRQIAYWLHDCLLVTRALIKRLISII